MNDLMLGFHNNVLDYIKTPEYNFFLNKIIKGGTTDRKFFEGHTVLGDYRLQQIPCEFAAYLCFLFDYFKGLSFNYLEIGSCAGGNLRHIYEILPRGNYFSCDNMSYPECQFQNYNFIPLKHSLVQFKGSSSSKEFKDWLDNEYPKKFDIIFIDGSHAYQDVIDDFELLKNHVGKNGFIVFHDTKIYDPSNKIEASKAFEALYNDNKLKVYKHFENPNERQLGITITRPMEK